MLLVVANALFLPSSASSKVKAEKVARNDGSRSRHASCASDKLSGIEIDFPSSLNGNM
jgi:hypothetical protein